MIYSTTSNYRLSNQTAYSFKALDNEAAMIYTITLDRDGEEVDPDHLLAAERAAYRALYGKLEPGLSEWVRSASSSERKSVMVWVREPPGLPRITPPIPHSGVSQDAIDRYEHVASPARAYNVIAVGGFDDNDTATWTYNCLMPISSWCDPASQHMDREKPEIVAPGASIKSTLTVGPDWVGCTLWNCDIDWFCACRTDPPGNACQSGYWGTSFAAPIVTGVAALMIQRSRSLNSALEAWPEAITAILMATALHNIEGDTRLSECDGAGGVVADLADDVVRGVNGNWGATEYVCGHPSPDDVATINLLTGQRVRVVIAWLTDPGSPNYLGASSKPSADLDLLIVNSANQIIDKSSSYDNTYEIVDFVVPANGVYKIQVVWIGCEVNYPPGYLAWAWWVEAP